MNIQQAFSVVSAASVLVLSGSLAAQGPPPPGPLQPPPTPAGNPVTENKALLGKALFWEEQLSSTATVACGTCHALSNGGADTRILDFPQRATHPGSDGVVGTDDDILGSPGVPLSSATGTYLFSELFGLQEQVTGRKSPAAVNAGYDQSLFWDGRASGTFQDPLTGETLLAQGAALESQVLGPPLSDVEMAHLGRDWDDVTLRLITAAPLALSPWRPAALDTWMAGRDYPSLFQEVFGSPEITPVRIAMAIATYERTLFTNQAPVDLAVAGGATLSPQEQRGRNVFNSSNCNACHGGNRFSDDQFHYIGVRPQAEDLGRFNVTGANRDRGAFRTPSLRNVELRAPYMHNGRFQTLEEVVEFYNRGGDFDAPNKDRNIRPLNLTQQQKLDLLAFLRRPLTDPRLNALQPPFDPPMLYTESDLVPQIIGPGVAGALGFVPEVIAISPPLAGNPRFTIAVAGALGGATARLEIQFAQPREADAISFGALLQQRLTVLAGDGPGNGHGSVVVALPANPAIIGRQIIGRWHVDDPAAPGGVAISPDFSAIIFGPGGETTPLNEGEPEVEGEGAFEGEGASEGEAGAHSADWNHDGVVSLTELLRAVQLLNSGGYHCLAGSEDSFSPGPGDTACAPHASDYAPQDWRINLPELLRLIQFFNSGSYHPCDGGEDGFCLGSASVN